MAALVGAIHAFATLEGVGGWNKSGHERKAKIQADDAEPKPDWAVDIREKSRAGSHQMETRVSV
jgi:hypothetical protein